MLPLRSRTVLLAGAGLLVANRIALNIGLRRRIDGWRRAAGLVLRGARSTFFLSAFGLDVWSDARGTGTRGVADAQDHVEERLHEFLRSETETHIRIRRDTHEDRAEPAGSPSYTIRFQKWVDGADRFAPPEDWSGEIRLSGSSPDEVLFNFVCRVAFDGRADVWVRVNHVGADGVPAQEMLSRLENAWGFAETVLFPRPSEFDRPCVSCDGIAQSQVFVDFAPLLAWRKEQNARLSEPMTVSAAMIWWLGRHAAFAGLHIGSTVEVEATNGLGRGVGVVVAKPADSGDRGLENYVRNFNRGVALTRARASDSCKTLDAAARLPATLAKGLLRHALEQDPRTFGSMALTVLKDAKVFGAPIGAFGHPRGFLAVGSIALPTRDGRRVGCVTIKGPEAVVGGYPALIQGAMQGY